MSTINSTIGAADGLQRPSDPYGIAHVENTTCLILFTRSGQVVYTDLQQIARISHDRKSFENENGNPAFERVGRMLVVFNNGDDIEIDCSIKELTDVLDDAYKALSKRITITAATMDSTQVRLLHEILKDQKGPVS